MTDDNSNSFCTARINAAFKTLNCNKLVHLQWHKMFLFSFYIDL